jgi:hypothetical protein
VRNVSGESTVPLCRIHHREVYRSGDEAAWWRNTGLDATMIARKFWNESHSIWPSSDEVSRERRGGNARSERRWVLGGGRSTTMPSARARVSFWQKIIRPEAEADQCFR